MKFKSIAITAFFTLALPVLAFAQWPKYLSLKVPANASTSIQPFTVTSATNCKLGFTVYYLPDGSNKLNATWKVINLKGLGKQKITVKFVDTDNFVYKSGLAPGSTSAPLGLDKSVSSFGVVGGVAGTQYAGIAEITIQITDCGSGVTGALSASSKK